MKIDRVSSERLSLLRFPLIVGVVFIHMYGTDVGLANGVVGVNNPGYISVFVQYFISQGVARIAVPLFFLMSGYFFFFGFSWSVEIYREKINSRIKTLLVPFLFWNIFTLLLCALAEYLPATQGYFSGKNSPISTFGVYDYINAIFGINRLPIAIQFWFIRDLMVLVLLAPAIYLVIKGLPKIFFLGIFVVWFFNLWPFYIPSLDAFPFFYAGAYFACSNTNLFVLDRFRIAILSSYSAVLLIDTLTKGYEFNNYIHNTGVVLGVATALCLSKTIVGLNNVKRALLWAGGCSFFVFAVHELLLRIVKKVIYKVVAPSSDMTVLSLYFSIPVFVIFSSILVYAGMKSFAPRFLSIISGGRKA
jgi:hypothetical protein